MFFFFFVKPSAITVNFFFFSSRRRHTRSLCDWSSDVCSSDLDSLDQYDQRGALRIDARNLSRAVRRDGKTRMILKDVSLSIEPREFVALVGGSGTGKSTLMNALSGYAQATGGHVLVNGDDYYRNFDAYRTVLGYVPQDDIIHRTLPVDRELGYAAQLRLPADTAPAEISQRIARVLEDVE